MKNFAKLPDVVLKAFLSCFLPILTLIFEADPDGVIILNPDGPQERITAPYFVPNVFGVQNTVPFLCALLTALTLILGLLFLLSGKPDGAAAEGAASSAGFALSLVPLVGAKVITAPAIAIAAFTALQAVVSFSVYFKIKNTGE